jgi:mRNA interferase RelE/StbE
MFELIFDDAAVEFMSKLPTELKARIYKKIVATKESPYRYFERLSGKPYYKLRVGDYRVIAMINESAHRIEVTLIGHRKNIYKQV